MEKTNENRENATRDDASRVARRAWGTDMPQRVDDDGDDVDDVDVDGGEGGGRRGRRMDAFDVLLGARGRAGPSASTSASKRMKKMKRHAGAEEDDDDDDDVDADVTTTSAFVECPLCGRSLGRGAAVMMHAGTCDGRRGAFVGRKDGPVEDHRGRRSHTGRTTTGYTPTDDLRGGWLERRGVTTPEEDGENGTKDAFAEMTRASERMSKVPLRGHFLIENFITEEEEERIVRFLDDDVVPWKDSSFNGAHQGKRYGVEVNLLKRTVDPAKNPLPKILRDLVIARFASAHETLRNFTPNECNAINYRKDLGSELTAHCDDRQLSSDLLVNLSLMGDCTMTYIHDKFPNSKKVDVYLPRRSLQIQSGETRYDYMHSISNSNLHANRRVSVTFRESGVLKRKER